MMFTSTASGTSSGIITRISTRLSYISVSSRQSVEIPYLSNHQFHCPSKWLSWRFLSLLHLVFKCSFNNTTQYTWGQTSSYQAICSANPVHTPSPVIYSTPLGSLPHFSWSLHFLSIVVYNFQTVFLIYSCISKVYQKWQLFLQKLQWNLLYIGICFNKLFLEPVI